VANIGPNAITRLAEALRADGGEDQARQVFAAAGLADYLHAPPTHMVDEREVAMLHRALRAELGDPHAEAIARDAGARTGAYLLAHRIPRAAQWVLKRLPAVLASHVLLAAVRRNAWTFAGSGCFTARGGRPSRIAIAQCPLCHGAAAAGPSCAFYAATFERLFRALVTDRTRVVETACTAAGADACRFEARW
jgi:divinyl protochlorophyllide a 8-vinyl-reductase